jgi:hypothetical protein
LNHLSGQANTEGPLMLQSRNLLVTWESLMRMLKLTGGILLVALLCFRLDVVAQAVSASANAPLVTAAVTSTSPVQRFHDSAYKLSFDYPANWTFSHSDREISTFQLDARSAAKKTIMRAVVAMPENPFPASTFSGAYFYFSVTPHISSAACARQVESPAAEKPAIKAKIALSQIAGIPFNHGHDEQRDICITQRDDIYTTYRRGVCYRFDLASNNFCGGEVSGVKAITPRELDQVLRRQESILSTVRFDPK